MKGKDLDLLIFVDLKKKRWKKKTSKHGIFDSKIRCWLLQIERINKVIHKNKTLLKHDDATNPRRRERARL